MSRTFHPEVVTANALLEGEVVYLTADDRWSRHHRDAELIEDEAHARRCGCSSRRRKRIVVVGAYLAEARPGPHGPEPAHFREAFRTRGPSNYPPRQAEPRAALTTDAGGEPCTPTPISTKASSATRVAQFRDQVARRIDGSLTEDEFKPLRLMNGLYLQLHAYMLRVAIPYGTMNPTQMRQLAMIAERWDKGYGHFTTRQNIQFNWPQPGRRARHARRAGRRGDARDPDQRKQRSATSPPTISPAPPRTRSPTPGPVAELLRQWSTDHPEFQFLPRKFKIAITGSPNDRAVTKSHDIGLRMVERDGEPGFEVSSAAAWAGRR